MPKVAPENEVRVATERKAFLDDQMSWHPSAGKISELGYRVLDLISDWVYGLHHFDSSISKKVDWTDQDFIEIKWRLSGMATFDFDHLTRLVFLSHDKMVRVEINPQSSGMFCFLFHGRHSRTGGMCDRLPTMETVLNNWREKHASL